MKDKYFVTSREILETQVDPKRRNDEIVKAFLSGVQHACMLYLTSETVEVEFIEQEVEFIERSHLLFHMSNGTKVKVTREIWKPVENSTEVSNIIEGQVAQLFHTSFIKVSDSIVDVYRNNRIHANHLSARFIGIPPTFLLGVIRTIPVNQQAFVRVIKAGDKFQLELASYVHDFFHGRKVVKEFDNIQLDIREIKPITIQPASKANEGKVKVVPLDDSFKLYDDKGLVFEIPRKEVHYSLVKPLLDNEHRYGGSISMKVLKNDLYLVSHLKSKHTTYYHPLSIPELNYRVKNRIIDFFNTHFNSTP
ncbi:TPA: hypothetical protein SFZ43_000049 [Campylobacter jejuni]|nr:hypothetical protein [Campylobacter jejuni]